MARRHHPDQYTLDYGEGSRNERFALLMSAIEVLGLIHTKPLAMLVFNLIEANADREPVGYSIEQYAAALGCSKNTARQRRDELSIVGVLTVEARARERGGTRTSLVSINWPTVRTFATDRPSRHKQEKLDNLDRAPIFGYRAPNSGGRAPNFGAPIKEYHSPLHSLEHNTTTTKALPHAPPLPETVRTHGESRVLTEEEEDFLRELLRKCFEKIPRCPRFLHQAMRQAVIVNGLTVEQVRTRCQWFANHGVDWPAEHRAGVFYKGIAEAMPEMPADKGWPYQR